MAVGPFWLEALIVAVLTSAAALVAWLLWGPLWALLVVGLIGVLYGMHHLRQMSQLLAWLEQPTGTHVPPGRGAWEGVFATLHRRAKRAAEERRELSEALERFRHAAQALPEGVVILDAQRAIEWLNPRAEGHLGLSLAHDVGSPITNLVREPAFIAYIEAGQYAEPLILHPLRTPGRTLELQAVRYGESQRLLLSRDISKLARLETMRRDFVANVSHELKTPLTVVSGFVETLLDSLPELSHEDALHFLGLASQQAQRMQHLIDDLLTLSALETDSPPPAEERVALAGLFAELLDEAHALSKGRHELRIEPAPAPGACLLGSRKELRSACANLLSNAVRYTPEGGVIRLSWQATPDGGGVCSVIDSGIGIASQHLPRLTERFYRVDRGRSTETGGTGLGLAIVKHILERHQATLEITSQLGHGSTFAARFPAKRVAFPQLQQ